MDGQRLAEFRRKCALNGDILRNLVTSVDDRLVDALVTHAESGGRSTAAPAATEEVADKESSKKASATQANVLTEASADDDAASDD
jgi:hypothetical protein